MQSIACILLILFCSSFGHLRAQLKGYDDDPFDGSPAVISHIDTLTLASVPEGNSNPPNSVKVGWPTGRHCTAWSEGRGLESFSTDSRKPVLKVSEITNLESLAYCPTTGDLYSTTFAFGSHLGGLVRIDRATGVGELVGGSMALDVRIGTCQ